MDHAPIENRARLAPDELDAIAAAVRAHRTLEDVVRWGALHAPPVVVADVIAQDEFTLDVLVPYRGHWLVYDTT